MIAQMAARLNAQTTLDGVIRTVLDDTIALVGADFGDLQLVADNKALIVVAQRGFDCGQLRSLRNAIAGGDMPSVRAALTKRSAIIEEIDHEIPIELRDIALEAGFSSMHSTPLISHGGHCVGVVSTHFKARHIATPIEMRMLETYSRISADRIAALLGTDPVSLHAERLFERMLQQAPAGKSRARHRRLSRWARPDEDGLPRSFAP
jgi:GAF domain-containing protein